MENTLQRKAREGQPVITEKYIDVRKIFRSKNPRLAGSIPGFIFRLLEKIIHQDGINDFMYRNRDKWGLDYAEAILDGFRVSTRVVNPPDLSNGRYLIASNHPLGGMDGIALIHETGKLRKDLLFPVNDLLLNLPNLYELFIPVNKHGSNAENIRLFNETFASDVLILYFPAGLVSRKQSGEIKDVEWKKTFLTKAKQSGRDIVPVHMAGRNTEFFYNLANFRKRLGIKANIEMLFLPDELFKYQGKEIVITYGNPIPIGAFNRSKSDQEWASLLREHVYKLEKNPNEIFNY
ncbi:MAG: glycerol acyltransferase [Bacteroidales bacterium]|jgi:putative hemolysin|nr:glycerol acyltransferase [Bacteroidales bacterium]